MEQDIWANIQLHRPIEHGIAEEQAQLLLCSISTGAGDTSSGSITGNKLSSFLIHPYCRGSVASGGILESRFPDHRLIVGVTDMFSEGI